MLHWKNFKTKIIKILCYVKVLSIFLVYKQEIGVLKGKFEIFWVGFNNSNQIHEFNLKSLKGFDFWLYLCVFWMNSG